MKNHIIQFLVFSILIISCRNDEYNLNPGEITPIDETKIMVETNLSGLIKDENGELLGEVEVVVNDKMTTTDQNGFFTFKNIVLAKNGTMIKVEKEGYFHSIKFANGWPGENSYLEVKLIEKKSIEFSSDQFNSVLTNGGGRIEFQPNSFVDQNNMPYQGSVRVYSHWFDPTSTSLPQTMPGDLRGVNFEDESVQLTTFGMMAVELEGDSGQELKLKDGSLAILNFPIPSGVNTEGITKMPTWHLDEEHGSWIEEGEANLVDGNWVAEVSHFSFWNCDIPGDYVRLSGQLLNGEGTPIANTVIVAKNSFDNTTASSTTNQFGRFEGFVPAGVILTLNILDCDNLVEIFSVGSIDLNTDLGIIPFDYNYETEFVGQLVDCSATPISNGYVTIETITNTRLGVVDENGVISIIINDCNESEATLRAYDLVQNLESDPIVVDLNQAFIDLETIQVCNEVSLLECQINLLCCPTSGFAIDILDGTAPFDVKIFDEAGILVEAQQFNTDQFDVIVGSGQTYDIQIEDADGEICFTQKEVPQYLNRIKGNVWIDEENGITNKYDALDTAVEGLEVFLIHYLLGQELNVGSTLTDMNGEYTFENFLGGDYGIAVTLPNGSSFVDQGELIESNDSHVDNMGNSPIRTIGSWDFNIDYIFNAGLKN